VTAIVLPFPGHPHHRVINRQPLTDATALAKPIAAGAEALRLMQLISPIHERIIERALNLWANPETIRNALIILAEHAADLDLRVVDRLDLEQRRHADMVEADASLIPAVVTGLTPRMSTRERDVAWEQLTDAVTRAVDLRNHRRAGTTPRYLRREGRSAQEAMKVEDEEVNGIVADKLAKLCVHGHRTPDGPDGAA
jgi:hypothetical protein